VSTAKCTQLDSRGIYWHVSDLKKINQKFVRINTQKQLKRGEAEGKKYLVKA